MRSQIKDAYAHWPTLVLLPLLLATPACGAMTAAANPKNAWCLKESAPLVVLVDRADAAEQTSKEVQRLMTATPTNDQWSQEVNLTNDQVRQLQKDQAARFIYSHNPYNVVPAIIWAKALAALKNDGATDPTLLNVISPDIGGGYAQLVLTMATIDQINQQIADEERAENTPGISGADKKVHEDAIAAKKADLDKARAAVEPAEKAFVDSVKAMAAKVAPDVRDKYGATLVNLRQAVDDAEVANGVAVVKYPFAAAQITHIQDQLIAAAKGNVTDIIFEQTGKHLDLTHFQVGATFDGQKVGVEVSGIGTDDLGKLQLGDLVTETISRTERFAGKAVTLLATTSSTEDRLSFEADLLDAMIGGFKSAGWSAPDSVYVPNQNAIAIDAGAAPPPRPDGGVLGVASLAGVFGGGK